MIYVIVVICYLIGEIYKVLFINKKEIYKLIPIIVSLTGGLFGILIFFTNKELINVDNFWDALLIGLISGASSTGTNQIIKQLFIKDNKEESL